MKQEVIFDVDGIPMINLTETKKIQNSKQYWVLQSSLFVIISLLSGILFIMVMGCIT